MSTTSEHATRATAAAQPVRVQTPFRRFLSDFFESRVATAAIAVFGVILFIAIFAPWISPQDPYDLMVVDVMDSRLPPGEKSLTGMTFLLGSDGAGRDMLSAIFYGLRTSLGVGVMSGIIALCIGMTVGLTAAYFGGRTDSFIMRIVDLQLSFPAILIALILLSILGKGVDKIPTMRGRCAPARSWNGARNTSRPPPVSH
jgi:peptide/nickel transport system permease protein